MKLSDAVRALMKEKGWTGDDLARRAHIAHSTLYRVLAGYDVSFETVRKLQQAGVRLPTTDALLSA